MSRYVFIESRDPFESRDTEFVHETAMSVRERGHDVTLFLVQNGVLAARNNHGPLKHLAAAGVTLLADDLSLRERGIKSEDLPQSIKESTVEELVEAIVQEKTKAIWH
jgi:sulfur relay protein TusB/DsrH